MTPTLLQRTLLLVGCGVCAAVTGVSAQQPPPQGAPPPGTAPAQTAPVMRFETQGVGLEEAVRITLQHDPVLQQQEQAVAFQRGVVQQERGAFDPTLVAGLFAEHRVQELSEARKQSERDKRTQLEDNIRVQRTELENQRALRAALEEVERAPVGSQPQLEALARISGALASQIASFDRLIAATTDADTRAQLIAQRNRFIQDNLALVRGQVTEFDRLLAENITRRENLGDPPVDEVFYRYNVDVAFQKLFRTGIGLAPFIEGSMEGTNFKGKPNAPEFGGKGLKDLYTLRAGLGFAVPLLRGRGATAVAARERAATIEQEAAELDLQHERSVSALQTIQAYWSLRGAQESVDIARRSVELQGQIAELTSGLIEAGDLPGIERSRAQASEARSRAQLEDTERRLRIAQVALATAMGLGTTGEPETLPTARDPFPALESAAAAATLQALALDTRADIVAAERRQAAGEVIVEGAGTELRALLDLRGRVYYTALDESTLANTWDRWVGPSIELTADFEKPLGNNRARGALAQAEADVQLRRIAAADLRRQVRLRTLSNLQTLQDAIERVRLAEQAVGYYQTTVGSELERLKAGESTLIDNILTEQQQTDSRFALISARQELAQLIAQLRFESGTLLQGGAVSLPNLTTPPAGVGR